ncbi:glycosyltransferase family 2 protein [Actibacterium ureilyticum]|uniref:glycosyltransferase family 2 protein n=1 Tax=Actibacterium ureilyticum TaxID=1590614 RepID=UPI000BAAE1B0|nr:glycosyltransferase family 2 protein [Actibacterium ureilyticum]
MTTPETGVVIVTFNSGDVIIDCLETLMSAARGRLRVVVVDNASTDDTVARIRRWAAGEGAPSSDADLPFAVTPLAKPIPVLDSGTGLDGITIVQSDQNLGFAGGVNLGLERLRQEPSVGYFWVLNPDCVTPPDTVDGLLRYLADAAPQGMIGGRVNYVATPDVIQIDGGLVNFTTGVTGNVHLGASHALTPAPDVAQIDFITGANMIVSRSFLDQVGLMREDYFLYYEEVDWAMRRGDLPLHYCADLLVYHHAGTSIGSPTVSRIASPFSLYFKHRARMMFLRRFNPRALVMGYAYSVALILRTLLQGHRAEAWAIFAAINGRPAPKAVRARLSQAAQRIAFGTYGA